MIKLVYKFLPVYIRYVPDAEWKRGSHAGWYNGWFPCVRISIRESHRDDSGLLEHELTHARQIYALPLLYWLLYKIAWFRYRFELAAYRVQLNHEVKAHISFGGVIAHTIVGKTISDKFASYLCDWYGLNVSKQKVKHDLLKGIR